ncbi:MAG: UDP-2,3-diacylglucosamine diphosphatase [Flavobacteriales bacterium]|nr:UDP-2,3-diacylglucosamine diphosphatase [Flavobacteriales bacterium]MCW8912167.1 UDP-2,3-diacylglucosamine diphosphatase [Flavobacteriales bacterium]MCW8938024.1 UDP-2,3-diacylglucosamine diphosphatase [Flavobacteriales bacterium]MCW8940063.1 UDP-2,3-diacylglucosamine diphosphatase [Flavobacteriales bacterium]MCW8967257.1 UDP-2,3-diacylglucosamine diphosphatase [Flavobacteriales bacterium]
MNTSTKIYFASDFHLGAPNHEESKKREVRVVRWLNEVKKDASEIYLLGDIFDFWFEYKTVIPKGFVRLQGKIAEITDSGIPIHVFTGNHDMWIFDYLPKELGIKLYREPIIREYDGKKFFIGHGDGLGPGDKQYKMLKAVFASKVCQWFFARIHPNLGIGVANAWSRKSRRNNITYDEKFEGKEKELLYHFCVDYLKKEHVDYFIFGHRHLPLEIPVGEHSTYFNLGEWIKYNTYAVFDGEKLEMKKYG